MLFDRPADDLVERRNDAIVDRIDDRLMDIPYDYSLIVRCFRSDDETGARQSRRLRFVRVEFDDEEDDGWLV